MTNLYQPEDVTAHNQLSLKELVWILEQSSGKFSLILASCNSTSFRKGLVSRLQECCALEIREIVLKPSVNTLYTSIQAALDQELPQAVMVYGLESVTALDQLLRSANRVREEFRKNFHFPLVLWVTDKVLIHLIRLAPDFYSWATTIEFKTVIADLIDYIKRTTDEVLDQVIEAGAGQLLGKINVTFDLEFGSPRRVALESAWKEIQSKGVNLDPELEASLEFVLGLAAKESFEESLKHYKRSSKLWQQSNNLVRRGCLLFYLGRWYRTYADRHLAQYDKACSKATKYFQQSIEIFEQCHRPDLVAKFINALGDILQRLEKWDELEVTAKKALNLYPNYSDDKFRLARAYGFLAQVALNKSEWFKTQQYAQQALENFKSAESALSKDISFENSENLDWERSYHKGWYLLALAQAQQHQVQAEKAIKNLETARKVTCPEYDAKLYIQILEKLQSLYFDQGKYIRAFELKQEQRSIEQQYGFRVFIGAGRLQPEKTVTNPALLPIEEKEKVAQEIVASGRQQDIEHLVERIGQSDRQLTVIYGPSGVGKSSLLQAGLIPTLKQKPIGGRDVLPVLQQEYYPDWIRQLGRCLAKSLTQVKNMEQIKHIDLKEVSLDQLKKNILRQLEKNTASNLLTVIIFDQFEEFFLISKTIKQTINQRRERRDFYEFLRDCLDIPHVRVILSLREDYLHYLLECNRFKILDVINNNILDKTILYYLGNLSLQHSKSFIQKLTESTALFLEESLIDQLLNDLADESNEIMPIKLQIVGAELETKGITKYEEYKEHGYKKYTKELFKQYLLDVVKSCGSENKDAAILVLYLFTDEYGTRQLKTLSELKTEFELTPKLGVHANELDLVLDLVLRILVLSGLVFEVPHSGSKNYQLSHDYLGIMIRQQLPPDIFEQLKQAKQQLQQALSQEKEQRKRAEIAEIEALNAISEALWLSQDQLGALVASLKAGKKSQKTETQLDIKTKTVNLLGNVIYRIQERNRFHGHTDMVNSVRFSPDGKKIASAGADCTLNIWSHDGSKLGIFSKHDAEINSICFSPDSQTIVSASADHTLKLWSLDGTELKTFRHDSYVNSVSFSPDGEKITSASADGEVKIWNLDGKEPKTFKAHNNYINSIRFSPNKNDQIIATASADGTVKIWSVEGKELDSFQGHGREINSISFSPDGQIIALANADGTVKLWNIKDKQLQTFEGHNSNVKSVCFSPKGQKFASAGTDGTVRLWSLDGTELQTFLGHIGEASNVCFDPDGKTIVSAGGDGTVKLWEVSSTKLQILPGQQTRSERSNQIRSISFSSDSKMFAVASIDDMVRIWSIEGKQLHAFKSDQSGINSLCFSPDNTKIASASADHTVKLWSIEGIEQATFRGHTTWVRSVCFSSKEEKIISASAGGTMKFCDFQGNHIKTIPVNRREVSIVSCSPNGQKIVSVSTDGMVRIWSIEGKLLKNFRDDPVKTLSFSPNSQIIALGKADGTVTLWGVDGLERQTFKGHNREVNSVCFSADGQTITSASVDGVVKRWNLKGKELSTLRGPSKWVRSIWLSPDSETIVSVSTDGTLILWKSDLNFDLDNLLERGCNWACDYLKTNPNVSEGDRHLCDDICNH
ncbi:MAG: hypothetical protein AB4426_10945 [Xenococcaceae cyanobacterium]